MSFHRVFRVLLLPVSLLFGACAAPPGPSSSECSVTAVDPPVDEPATGCASPTTGCKRFYLPLLGDLTNPEVRAKYKAAFGSACYVSVANTFNCWYEEKDVLGPKKDGNGQACKDAKRIGDVSGLAIYDQNEKYKCQKDGNTGDYYVQVGPDVANVLYIRLDDAPLETSLIEVDGGPPLEVNGPYRNLVEVTTIEPGKEFYCTSGQPGPDGGTFDQREWILQVNRNANGGKIRSDLAGFMYPCRKGCPQICTEPEFLNEPPPPDAGYDPNAARVHHVQRKKDLRGCDWGTNAYKNAAVISDKLNIQLRNYYPLANEVNQINKVAPYTP